MNKPSPANYNKINWKQRKILREQYVLSQNGLCYFCKNPLTEKPNIRIEQIFINLSLFPPNFLKYPVHLHHCHNSGMTIGAVHAKCNAVLWQYCGE